MTKQEIKEFKKDRKEIQKLIKENKTELLRRIKKDHPKLIRSIKKNYDVDKNNLLDVDFYTEIEYFLTK